MPAITKANLIALANALKEAQAQIENLPALQTLKPSELELIHETYAILIARVCSQGNSNFDRARFLNAAGA